MHLENFIDKVKTAEIQNRRDVILSLTDAKSLRDEISKLLIAKIQEVPVITPPVSSTVTSNITINGGRWGKDSNL